MGKKSGYPINPILLQKMQLRGFLKNADMGNRGFVFFSPEDISSSKDKSESYKLGTVACESWDGGMEAERIEK